MANNRFFCFTLILIFLLISHDEEARMVVVARTCESQSHHFKGPCVSDHNCGLVCKNEGFDNGWCRGFRHRCFCTRRCLHHPTSINATT